MFKKIFWKVVGSIDKVVKSVPYDKAQHMVAGWFIFMITIMITQNIGLALALAVLAGAGKELIWDLLLKKGTPEFMDFVATIAIPLGIWLISLIKW